MNQTSTIGGCDGRHSLPKLLAGALGEEAKSLGFARNYFGRASWTRRLSLAPALQGGQRKLIVTKGLEPPHSGLSPRERGAGGVYLKAIQKRDLCIKNRVKAV